MDIYGKRFKNFGVFAKGRPGVLYASKGDLFVGPTAVCPAVFPPPSGCFQTRSLSSFALDVGGVVEFYPTQRTLVRVDVGDTMIRRGDRNVSGDFNSGGALSFLFLAVTRVPAETTHSLQASVGVGFRF